MSKRHHKSGPKVLYSLYIPIFLKPYNSMMRGTEQNSVIVNQTSYLYDIQVSVYTWNARWIYVFGGWRHANSTHPKML